MEFERAYGMLNNNPTFDESDELEEHEETLDLQKQTTSNADGIRLQVYNCSGLSIRHEPSMQAQLVPPNVLSPGDVVLVVDVVDEWSEIKLPNGSTAYVLSKYLMGV